MVTVQELLSTSDAEKALSEQVGEDGSVLTSFSLEPERERSKVKCGKCVLAPIYTIHRVCLYIAPVEVGIANWYNFYLTKEDLLNFLPWYVAHQSD